MPFNLAKIIAIPYNFLINTLLFITQNTSKLPFSKIYVKTPYTYQIILYYILIFSLLYLYKTNNFQKILKYKKQIIAIFLIIFLIPNIIEEEAYKMLDEYNKNVESIIRKRKIDEYYKKKEEIIRYINSNSKENKIEKSKVKVLQRL